MGRPPFEATPERRKRVETLAAMGMSQSYIAKDLGITERTLRERFREELDAGMVKANTAVASNLYAIAMDKTHPKCVTAAIFWLKARAGWREADRDTVPPPPPAAPEPQPDEPADAWAGLLPN